MKQKDAESLATKTTPGAEITDLREGLGTGRRLVVFGAGYVGGALVRRALAAGWRVVALTRNPETAAALRADGAEVVVAELASDVWWDAPELADGADRVAVTVAAGGGGAEGYRRSYVEGLRSVVGWARKRREQGAPSEETEAETEVRGRDARASAGRMPGPRLGTLIYTSSTSVYPQSGCARVTEAAAVGGEAETTRALIEAERIAGEWREATGAGAVVLRLAGIYGPGRVHLVNQVRSGEVAGEATTHLNLIYRDDILSAMEAAWERGTGSGEPGASAEAGAGAAGEADGVGRAAEADEVAEIFNLADEGGATKGEVVAWLAERLGVALPRFTGAPAGGRRALTPDRIIDASKARVALGWRPRWPTFREGYAEVLRG